MRNKQRNNQDASAEDNEIESRVEAIMGLSPMETNPGKVLEEPSDDKEQPERILVIPDSDNKNIDKAPPVAGSIVVPEPSEQKEASAPEDDLGEDTTTQEAVEDIVAKEGDEVLAAEDAEVAKAFEPPKHGFKAKVKSFFRAWWNNKKARYGSMAGLVIILIGLTVVPTTRYFILNTAGVRASASLTVLDGSTQLPLKNVTVKLGGQSGKTDSDGIVKLPQLKLGRTQLVIQKRAFAEKSKPLTVGWGSNKLGEFSLEAVGAQYIFLTKDFLSGKAIEKAEASSGEASALADKTGKIILTIDTTEENVLEVSIKAANYRAEKIKLDLNAKAEQSVSMVPDRKAVFISNRAGKYDVFKIDVDGKNEKLVLAGTGTERDDMVLAPHPTDEEVALVSTRDNVRNKDGYILSTLTLIDLSDNSTTKVIQSERVQVIGWIGKRVIYVQVAAGASAANPKRNRLMSYDYKTDEKQEIASANSFNDVLLVGDSVYYAPSSNYQKDPNTGFIKSNADGKTKKTLLAQEVWTVFRVEYAKFDLSVQDEWYEYKLGDTAAVKLSAAPANPKARVYVDSPDNKRSLWIDQRDGKGALIAYNTVAKTDKILKTQSGISSPLRWLTNNTLIYRIRTDQETADYVLNIDGGEAKKIRDVFNSAGTGLWYYY